MASFLDKVRAAQTNTKKEGENNKPSVNPLLANKHKAEEKGETPQQKKINPLLAALNKKKTHTEETKHEEETTAKQNVFAKPKDKTEKDTDDIKNVSEEKSKTEEVKTKKGIIKDKPQQEVKEDQKKEETKVIPEEKKDKKTEDKKENIVEDKKEDESKPKNNKKDKNKKKKAIDEVQEDTESIKDFNQAVKAIKSNFEDPEWNKYVESIKESLSKIIIEADMTSAQLKVVMSDLSKLRDKIWLQYLDYKTEFEILAGDKPEGKIERIKKTSFTSKDKNDFDRKKAGILACMNYETEQDGKMIKINLFEVCDEYRKRFNFLSEVMKQISFKADALIKMSAGIKLQNSINN